MRFATTSQIIALASVAHDAAASLHGSRGGGGGEKGGGKGGGGDEERGKTVLVKIEKGKERGAAGLAEVCERVAAAAGGEVLAVYDRVLHGCGVRLSSGPGVAAAAATLRADPHVARIEEDGEVYAAGYSWGIDRVDGCDLPLGGEGTLTKVDATGVRIYIIDTGVDKGHVEFAGMIDAASGCHSSTIDGAGPFDDDDTVGHG